MVGVLPVGFVGGEEILLELAVTLLEGRTQ
jgi:hypothetical protein